LPKESYLKIVLLCTSLTHAKRLFRKRELINIIQCLSSIVLDHEWENLSRKFIAINGESLAVYDELLGLHHSFLLTKCMQADIPMEQISLIHQCYINSQSPEQEQLINRLCLVLSKKEAPLVLLKAISALILEQDLDSAKNSLNYIGVSDKERESINVHPLNLTP